MSTIRFLGACVGLIVFGYGTAWPQPNPNPYPNKAVRVVVVFPPGGATDIVARFVFQKMGELLNQQFLIDNRAGAAGMIGGEIVAKSPPDGYTIMVYSQTLLTNEHLYSKMPYDPLKDFIGITTLTRIVGMLAVHPSLPVRTTQAFIGLAKARPGEVLYGTAGIGGFQHLATSVFANMSGVKMIHVPFKGGAPAVVALMGGEVQTIITPIAELYPYLKSGRVRPIAVTSESRTTQFPHIPAIAETVKGYELTSWFGAFVPAGTPRPIVDKLNAELRKAVADPDVAAKLSAQTLDPMVMTTEAFAKYLKFDSDRLKQVVKLSGARIE
jgi:tripartite-type tricarboxylate transporter receptor subunit TctC